MNDLHPAYFTVRFRTETPVADWPAGFAIITAYATTGEHWSDDRNKEADQRLHAELLHRDCAPVRITGFDPHSGHAEPGWAVELPFAEALVIGRKYLQDAIFTVAADTLTVLSCREDGVTTSIGSFRDRLMPLHGYGA